MGKNKPEAWKALIRILATKIVDDMERESAAAGLTDNNAKTTTNNGHARTHLRSV
jgi:hypothetical protein